MNITIEGFSGPLPMEVAQRIHYHFPASAKEKNTFVLHMDGARITGEIEGHWVSLEQGGFLQEVANQSQVDIRLVTSHESFGGRPDTYTFLAQEEKTRLVFREAIDLLTNPKTARRYAELWNESEMPFEIDMDDPDAPWNNKEKVVTFYEFIAGIIEVALSGMDHPEVFMVIEIEHASHYSKESQAWNVSVNRKAEEMPYSRRFIDRIEEARRDASIDALKASIQPELHMTVLYVDGEFVLDDL